MFIEELLIDFIDGGKIIQIGDEHGHLDDIAHTQPGSNHDRFDVFEA
ncbi:Uncharacterised protein [Klebsiella pneumoniae]|nr:Uncharacterised protein [Klebsiella pneumoniae]